MAFTPAQIKESALRRDRLRNKTEKRIRWIRNRDLQRRFGITLDQFEAMHAAQQGLCAICKQPETWRRKGTLALLSVDHNHTTGKVRELLCSQCNHALGKLREDPNIIEALAAYVRKHSG